MDAKAEFLADINETRTRLGLSVEVMAINAGCPVSAMSEALAGKDGRNFAGHWITSQGDEFESMFATVRDARRGRTPEARRANLAREIGEVVRRLIEAAS